MSRTLAQVRSDLRSRMGDEGIPYSYVIPIGVINGTKVRFRIPLYPFESSDFELYNNDSLVASGDYTVNADTGLLTYDIAPARGVSHYCDLVKYRRTTTVVTNAIKGAERRLRNIWTNTYAFSGSGDSEVFDTDPADGDADILTITAHLQLLNRQLQMESETTMRVSDATGIKDLTRRIDALQLMISNTRRDLYEALLGGGYAGTIDAATVEFGAVFDPELGVSNASRVIILSG